MNLSRGHLSESVASPPVRCVLPMGEKHVILEEIKLRQKTVTIRSTRLGAEVGIIHTKPLPLLDASRTTLHADAVDHYRLARAWELNYFESPLDIMVQDQRTGS